MMADRDYKRKLRDMELAHRSAQEGQKAEHDNIVRDHYAEKTTNDRGEKMWSLSVSNKWKENDIYYALLLDFVLSYKSI